MLCYLGTQVYNLKRICPFAALVQIVNGNMYLFKYHLDKNDKLLSTKCQKDKPLQI